MFAGKNVFTNVGTEKIKRRPSQVSVCILFYFLLPLSRYEILKRAKIASSSGPFHWVKKEIRRGLSVVISEY